MNTSFPITIVLADDHPIVLKGLRDVLSRDDQLQIVGEASDGCNALALIEEHLPRVAVLDIDMPRMTGLEVVRQLQAKGLPVSVVILTVYDDESIFTKAMDGGVMGYILKDSAAVEIVKGIKSVAKGEYYVSPALTGKVMRRSHMMDSSVEERLGLQLLTPAERKVLRLVANEMTSAEIALALSVSVKTVEHHRTNICTKLNLSGHSPLLRFALEHKEFL